MGYADWLPRYNWSPFSHERLDCRAEHMGAAVMMYSDRKRRRKRKRRGG